MATGAPDPGDLTIDTYGLIAEDFARRYRTPAPEVLAFLDALAARVATGATVLEIGSGPGFDADHLERAGLRVQRTDATPAFLEMMRARGVAARRLDVRVDQLGGPYDAVLANAVLLHLPTAQFREAVARIHAATQPAGWFALTLKEGDGEGLTTSTAGHPRWFTYWREPGLRTALTDAGWIVESLEHVAGPRDDWLDVLARRAPAASTTPD